MHLLKKKMSYLFSEAITLYIDLDGFLLVPLNFILLRILCLYIILCLEIKSH